MAQRCDSAKAVGALPHKARLAVVAAMLSSRQCTAGATELGAASSSGAASRSWGLPDVTTGTLPSALPCADPVKRAPVKFPRHLLLGAADNDTVMYSGYVNVTERDYLFYWFAQAQQSAGADAPLIVWSNGGPGCSAMEGVTTENGPMILFGFRKQLVGRLSKNPYSWNKLAHVLYVDQPRYVGYSTGTGPFVKSSREAGLDMVQFLRGWKALFPEHAERPVILAAESYGGHFVPAWSAAILEHNRASPDKIRLEGLAIGNGAVDEKLQDGTILEWAKREGLVDGFPGDPPTQLSWGELMGRVTSSLGYVPNYYDYRVAEEECCGCSSYNYKAWSDWLLRPDVTEALNVCGEAGVKAFADCKAGCIEIPNFDVGDDFGFLDALSEALQEGIRVTLYYGMADTVCNWVGGSVLAHSLTWPGSQGFAAMPLRDLSIDGARSGSTKAYGGLTWVQVEGAGHMVPVDNPAAAFYAIRTLIPDAQGCEGSATTFDETSVIRKFKKGAVSKEGAVPEARDPIGIRSHTVVAFVAGWAFSAVGFLLVGGRALVAACREKMPCRRHHAGLISPRLRTSPLGDSSPVHSRTPLHLRSPDYMLAPDASSGALDPLTNEGSACAGWLDA